MCFNNRGFAILGLLKAVTILLIIAGISLLLMNQFYLMPGIKSGLSTTADKIAKAEQARKDKMGYFLSFSQSDQKNVSNLLGVSIEADIVCRAETIEADELNIYCFPDKSKASGWFYRSKPIVYVYKENTGIFERGFLTENGKLVK
jgi:hypothetical protein